MTSSEIPRETMPTPKEGLHDVLEFILSQYVAATAQPFKGNELRNTFRKFDETVADLPFVAGKFRTDWGLGQGKWADIPWLAILDPRETTSVQKGVYCILLFRDDCSGVYVTLNQGITEAKKLGTERARAELASRADSIRKQVPSLARKGFQLNNHIDLRSSGDRAVWYQTGTIAHKLYEQGKVPPDAEIISDLEELLKAYSGYVAGRSPERAWIFQANPEHYAIHRALAQLQDHTWLARQHADQIRAGDKVYIWVAGKNAGIVAHGRVTSDPSKFPPDPAEQPFTLKPEKFDGDWLRVRLHIDGVLAKPLLKTELVQIPTLAGLSIIKSPRSTNFSVPPEEAAAIEALLQPNTSAPERPAAKFDRAQALGNLIEAIKTSGFIFEPWQIATYVTALRTKPFVILAGISGTGKSKLPWLVQTYTGGICDLMPVRPDWTDSSDVLGYYDLKNEFREGLVLTAADKACNDPDQHFVCILDEMNLARVEQYFAEVLSKIEDRHPAQSGGFESDALLSANLQAAAGEWSKVGIPPNFAFVGTVNMDETTHSFSKKVLDRAFTIELSDVDLSLWGGSGPIKPASALSERWPVEAWHSRALLLAGLTGSLTENERAEVQKVIETLIELNRSLSRAQLQVGYRVRDEICLFVLHALETPAAFVTRSGAAVNPLDLAIQLKVLPRIVGGSDAVRRLLIQLIGWSRTGKASEDKGDKEDKNDANAVLEQWDKEGRPAALKDFLFPRTAARLCLMWERLSNEGYTSFWL